MGTRELSGKRWSKFGAPKRRGGRSIPQSSACLNVCVCAEPRSPSIHPRLILALCTMLRSLLTVATPRAAVGPLVRVAAPAVRSLHVSAFRAVIPAPPHPPPHKPKREWVGGPVSSHSPTPSMPSSQPHSSFVPPPPLPPFTPGTTGGSDAGLPPPSPAPRGRGRLYLLMFVLIFAGFAGPDLYRGIALLRRLRAADGREARDAVWNEFIAAGNYGPESQVRLRELQAKSEKDFEKMDEIKKKKANNGQ